jgi:hypothetical protein
MQGSGGSRAHHDDGAVLIQAFDDDLTSRPVTEEQSDFDVPLKDLSVPGRLHVDVLEPPRSRRAAGRFAIVAPDEGCRGKYGQEMSP